MVCDSREQGNKGGAGPGAVMPLVELLLPRVGAGRARPAAQRPQQPASLSSTNLGELSLAPGALQPAPLLGKRQSLLS